MAGFLYWKYFVNAYTTTIFYFFISIMTFPRLITIGGIGAAIIAGGIITYFQLQPTPYVSPEATVEAYGDFLEKIQDPSLKTKLAAGCENGDFKQQMQELQDQLAKLQQQKNNIQLPSASDDVDYGDLDLKPGQQVPDLGNPDASDDVDYGDLDLKPGQQPLDLEGNKTPIEDEYIPKPGEQVPDFDTPETTDDVDYGDLDLKPGQQPLDLVEPDPESTDSILTKINTMEQKILAALAALEKICDGAKGDCSTACTNYVNKCLSLVPNAWASLLKQWMDSCLQECKKRDTTKITCIANAARCEPMTEVCGL